MLKDRQKRDRKIAEAVEKYGYTQRAIARDALVLDKSDPEPGSIGYKH
jgi:hypothetical protein